MKNHKNDRIENWWNSHQNISYLHNKKMAVKITNVVDDYSFFINVDVLT